MRNAYNVIAIFRSVEQRACKIVPVKNLGEKFRGTKIWGKEIGGKKFGGKEVGEKIFWDNKFWGKIFLRKNIWGKKILGNKCGGVPIIYDVIASSIFAPREPSSIISESFIVIRSAVFEKPATFDVSTFR